MNHLLSYSAIKVRLAQAKVVRLLITNMDINAAAFLPTTKKNVKILLKNALVKRAIWHDDDSVLTIILNTGSGE